MGELRISSDLFIGSQELNRFQKLLSEDGFRRLLLQHSVQFGLLHKDIDDGQWDNFRVEQGTNTGTIKHAEGFALDINGELIYRAANDNIPLTDDNLWYWIKVAYQADPREIGLCSIDASGNLTGSSTEFIETLRGLPNNPVRVAFPDSTVNTGEYEVVEVIDSENVILAGDFIAESDVRYAVVGAFTPGISVPEGSKYPFQYDGCTMTLVQETVSNTPPALTDGEEFVIARVRRNGSTITIEDKRSRNIYRSKSDFFEHDIDEVANPLIGIEAIKFNNIQSPRDNNLIYLGFGFRSSNWTVDSSTNRLTLIAGNGGKFKSTSDFTDGDFDGWRVYTKNGKYKIVKQSSLSATQINLILDSLDADDFLDTTHEIHVVPNAEEIELIFTADPDDATSLPNKRVLLPINQGEVIVPLLVYKDPSCQYNVKYRYKNSKTYTAETAIPSDLVSGYYTEAAFDDDGVLTGGSKSTYTSSATQGFITLNQAGNSYKNVVDGLTTGQALGVEFISIDTDLDPVTSLEVGVNKEHIIISNDESIGIGEDESDFGTYILTADAYINLRTDVDIVNGNFFLIQFRGDYSFGGFSFKIVQDYINSGDTGITLYTLTQDDLDKAAEDNLIFKVVYDGTRWFIHKFISAEDTDLSGYVPTSRRLLVGEGLDRTPLGSDLSEDRTFSVIVDDVTLGVTAPFVGTPVPNALYVKSGSIQRSHLGITVVECSDVQLLTKRLTFTGWNMDTTARLDVAHGLGDATKIVGVHVTLFSGSGDHYVLPTGDSDGIMAAWVEVYDDTDIQLERLTSGIFDTAFFNDASGTIIIIYTE